MPTLSEISRQMSPQEERMLRIGMRDLYKLSYMHNAQRESYQKMQFELKLVSKLIETMKPKKVDINVDASDIRRKNEQELEFDPTFTKPNVTATDAIGREYSFWYKPLLYLPCKNEVKPLYLDFVMINGLQASMYTLDDATKVELGAYEFLPSELMHEMALKLMQKLKPLHLVMQAKDKFLAKDLNEIKDIAFFLKPRKFVVVTEDYVDDNLKLNIPFNVQLLENMDMNSDKFKDFIKDII